MKKLLIIFILLTTINCFCQEKYVVTAENGLILRDAPYGERIGKLHFNQKVTILEKTNTSFTYENIKGSWVKIETKNKQIGFVFNGFLKIDRKINYTYKNRGFDEYIYAEMDGKKTLIFEFDDKFRAHKIIEIKDYNNNGFEELLLESNPGGWIAKQKKQFTIFYYDGKEFSSTEEIGNDSDGIELDENQGKRVFIIDYRDRGKKNDFKCNSTRNTYVFMNYEFKQIKSLKEKKLETILELKPSDYSQQEIENRADRSITYDLNNDGIEDKIIAKQWEEAGEGCLVATRLYLNNKIVLNSILNYTKRIGILKSKTKNVNDLVINCNEILQWNGTTYIKKKQNKLEKYYTK